MGRLVGGTLLWDIPPVAFSRAQHARSVLPAAPLYAVPSLIAVLAAGAAVVLLASADAVSTGEVALLLTAIGLALGTVFLTVEAAHRHRSVHRAAAQDTARLYANVTVLLGRFDREPDEPALEEARDALNSLYEAQAILAALPQAPLRRELEEATTELERRVGPYRSEGEQKPPPNAFGA
jgi:hypothetical protein